MINMQTSRDGCNNMPTFLTLIYDLPQISTPLTPATKCYTFETFVKTKNAKRGILAPVAIDFMPK